MNKFTYFSYAHPSMNIIIAALYMQSIVQRLANNLHYRYIQKQMTRMIFTPIFLGPGVNEMPPPTLLFTT